MSTQIIEHSMESQVSDSTLSAQVPVQGKTTYGTPILKTLELNSWISNIGQEYAIGSFNYTTASTAASILFATRVFITLESGVGFQPWFLWYVSQYQAFECEFDLVFEPIQHSGHRGAFSVMWTLDAPRTDNVLNLFLPISNFDISGNQNQEFVYSIPSVYATPQKSNFNVGRILTPNKNGLGGALLPQLVSALGYVLVKSLVPLTSSSMLPSIVPIIIKLRPKIETLRVYHALLPSENKLSSTVQIGTWPND